MTSSLAQAFGQQAKSNTTHFMPGMQAAVPGAYLDTVEIKNSGAALAIASASTAEFTCPRSGIIRSCHLHITLSGAVMDSSSDVLTWSDAIAQAIVENVSLRSNSREILSMDSYSMAQATQRSIHKDFYHSKAGRGYNDSIAYSAATALTSDALGLRAGTTDSSWDNKVHLFLPVLLSPFKPAPYSNKLDTSFCERLQLQVRTRPVAQWCSKAASAVIPTSIEIAAVFSVACLENGPKESVTKATYLPGKSTQLLFERSSLIAKTDTKTGVASKISVVEATMRLNSTDLCRRLTFVAVPDSNNDSTAIWKNVAPKIISAKLEASGRVLADTRRVSAQFAALTHNATTQFSQKTGPKNESDTLTVSGTIATDDPESSAMSIQFCEDGHNDSYFSGGLALSGLSSQNVTLQVECRNNSGFKVHCYSDSYLVCTVSSDSGSVQPALSI